MCIYYYGLCHWLFFSERKVFTVFDIHGLEFGIVDHWFNVQTCPPRRNYEAPFTSMSERILLYYASVSTCVSRTKRVPQPPLFTNTVKMLITAKAARSWLFQMIFWKARSLKSFYEYTRDVSLIMFVRAWVHGQALQISLWLSYGDLKTNS